ncbi:hypothetical protein D3C71_1181050 [compost metagenome]
MVGLVQLQHAAGVVGQGLVAQVGVGLAQGGHGVVLERALRVVLQQEVGAASSRDVRLAAQVVQGVVQLILGEHVAQGDHPLARIGGVAAVRVALGDDGEIGIGLARARQVTAARVQRPDAAQEDRVAVAVGQATQVVQVGDVAVGRVGTDEAVHAGHRVIVLAGLVLGVGGFDHRLLGVRAIRVLGDQAPEAGLGPAPVAAFHQAVALLVDLFDRLAFIRIIALGAAVAASGDEGQDQQQGGGADGRGQQRGASDHGVRAGRGWNTKGR